MVFLLLDKLDHLNFYQLKVHPHPFLFLSHFFPFHFLWCHHTSIPAHRACSNRHIDPDCVQERGKVEVNNILHMNDSLACYTAVSCAFTYCDGCELWVTPSLVKINVQHLPIVILYITKFYHFRFIHLAKQLHKQYSYSTTAPLPFFVLLRQTEAKSRFAVKWCYIIQRGTFHRQRVYHTRVCLGCSGLSTC